MIQRNEFMNKNKKTKDELAFSSGEKERCISGTQMIPEFLLFKYQISCVESFLPVEG